MPAPSNTTWGEIVGGYGRIGLSISITNSGTQSTATIQAWFWSKYSVYDEINEIMFDAYESGAAMSLKNYGLAVINTTHDSGAGWDSSNQVLLKTFTETVTRKTTDTRMTALLYLSGVDRVGKQMQVQASYTVPAFYYVIRYDTNGGKGSISATQKGHGVNVTLTTQVPTREGYTFLGWSTSNVATSASYASGATYSGNANVTLYAVWKINTYSVTYNANGGSGAPAAQTKTYGQNLVISSTKPTRANYTFAGWSTSSTGNALYSPGDIYTANAPLTLYAVWRTAYSRPVIWNLTASRCNSSGTVSDEGTYAVIGFKWSSTNSVSSIVISWADNTGGSTGSATVSASGTSGTVSQVVGSGGFNTETTYTFTVTVKDSGGSSDRDVNMTGSEYNIDFCENKSTAVGKPAEIIRDGDGNVIKMFDSKWRGKFRDHLCVGDKNYFNDGQQGVFISNEGFMHLQRSSVQGYGPYIAFYKDNKTTPDFQMQLNPANGRMYFEKGVVYEFDSGVSAPFFTLKDGYIQNVSGRQVLTARTGQGVTLGKGHYDNADGTTTYIYGHDIKFGVANLATKGTYKPYISRGDTITLGNFRTAGYMTDAYGCFVHFTVPLALPVVGSPTVSGAISTLYLRQNGNFVYKNGSNNYTVTPKAVTCSYYYNNCVTVVVEFNPVSTSGATKETAVGIQANITLSFN